jgi:hypothetical protein
LPFEGDGKTIMEVSIRNALESKLLRAVENSRYGSIKGWISQSRSKLRDETELLDLLSQASHRIVPILLYYREDPLTADEQSVLGLAFRGHSLFAGTIHPELLSLSGRYL